MTPLLRYAMKILLFVEKTILSEISPVYKI